MKNHKKAVFALIPTIVFFLIINLILSCVLKHNIFRKVPFARIYDQKLSERIKIPFLNKNNNPKRKFRYVADRQRWFRLEKEPAIPNKGELILNFGDSSTYGWGLDNLQDAYPSILNHILKDVKSINLGVPYYSSLQGLRYVQKLVPQYHSRLVAITVYFGNNDSTVNGYIDSTMMPYSDLLWQWCPLCCLVQDELNRILWYKYRQPRVSPDEFETNLQRMVSVAKQYGVKVIIIHPPVRLRWKPAHLSLDQSFEGYIRNKWSYDELQKANRLYWAGLYSKAVEHDWVIPRLKQAWSNKLDKLAKTVPTVKLANVSEQMFVDYCHPDQKTHKRIAYEVAKLLK